MQSTKACFELKRKFTFATAVCCLRFVVCCLLFAVCCLLFAVDKERSINLSRILSKKGILGKQAGNN